MPISETLGAIGQIGSGIGSIISGSKDYSGGGVRLTKLGHTLDTMHFKKRFRYMKREAYQKGLTPQEFYGSPAAGSNPVSGGAQALGNAKAQENAVNQANDAQAIQGVQQASLGLERIKADRDIAKMQTDTQKQIAGVKAGVDTRGQDLQKEIADRVNNLKAAELMYVKIPQAAAAVKLSKQQLLTEIHRTATSSPKFQTAMKQLSMGPANLLVELTLRDEGISLSDDSFTKLPQQKREEILSKLVAMASSVYIEAHGAKSLGGDAADSSTGDTVTSIIESLLNAVTPGHDPIEKADKPQKKPGSLGSRANPTNGQAIHGRDARRTNPYR